MVPRDKYTETKDFENWKIWRNKVVSMLRDSKWDYYITLIELHKWDSKAFFKYISKFDPKCTTPDTPTIEDGDAKFTDHKDIAE